MSEPTPEHALIAWGWAGSSLEAESGDLHAVVPFPGGAVVALMDGLGHGPEAAAAAIAALPVLEAYAGDSVLLVVQRCHEALRRTRGMAISVASFRSDDSSMTWLGVGNVEGVLVRRNRGPGEAIAVRGGVVGYQLPPLRPSTLSVSYGDTLVLATDGIRSGFTTGLAVEDSPQAIADAILARFGKRTDDARVVVARYLGGG